MKTVTGICLATSLALVLASAACKSEKAAPSASATPAQSSASTSVATPPATEPVTTPTAAPATTPSSRPTVTPEQQAEIIDLTSRDPNVLRIIQGLTISNSKIVVWSNGQGTLIGGAMVLTLAQPATIEGEWRSISWVDSAKTNYGVTIYTARLSNVTAVNVWVDLVKGTVVGWSPNSNAKVETGPVIIATPATQ